LAEYRQRSLIRFAGAIAVLVLLVGGALVFKPPQFYPQVRFQATETLQVVILKESQRERALCEGTVGRVVAAVKASCNTCKVLEDRCLEQLDARQRKVLNGQPVDIPVMRIPDGAVAFLGSAPELALASCQESERQATGVLPPQTRCKSAELESKRLSLANISGQPSGRAIPGAQALVQIFLVAALTAFLVCYAIVSSERLHGAFSNDGTATGPQKYHALPTPRIGGLALASALAASVVAMDHFGWLQPAAAEGLTTLALAAIPAFAGGFGEDVTKRVSVLARLLLTMAAGVIASLGVGATLDQVDVPGIDILLQWQVFAVAFTAFAVGGMANAINIIDGYNGLVGGYAVLVLAALAIVSAQVGDPVVLGASLAMAGAVVGYFVWNYPSGRLFLGDGGAYLLGFWLAELSVLLVARNPEVSPWFPMVLLAYPVFETFFSIYRRKILRGHSPGHPDALHLHQLIYNRLARVAVGSKRPRDITHRNNMVAPYIWAASALLIVPALLLWRSTPALVALVIAFCTGYVWLYVRLTRWRAPAWLVISPFHSS
jgi:UDP-N-acetylmuramyl pentapeptide phosphotransferase/UDP-N-acetylglucosamine-1-phosphate transferase